MTSAPSTIVYDPVEAAHYARLHPATVRSWVGDGLDLGRDERGAASGLNFHEFIQLLAVRNLRHRGITLKTIRETMRFVREECGIPYPFASNKHATFTEGKKLYLQMEGESGIFTATGREQRQLQFPPIVEVYMSQLEFDEQGMARKYLSFQHANQTITLAPDEYYGQPIVAGTSYTAFSLADAAENEGGIEAAAEVYGVPKEHILAAVAYVDFLGSKPAVAAA